jgi:hypothetical protein
MLIVRGERVLLDADLARFPNDFTFRLTQEESERINRSQIATGSQKHRDPRFLPVAFTEHGALMAANVLNSRRAIEASVYVTRTFVRLRKAVAENRDLVVKLDELERKTEALSLRHDAFSAQLKQVFDALRQLMTPAPGSKRSTGFTAKHEP